MAIFGIGEADPLGITAIPGVLGRAGFANCRFLVKGGTRGACGTSASPWIMGSASTMDAILRSCPETMQRIAWTPTIALRIMAATGSKGPRRSSNPRVSSCPSVRGRSGSTPGSNTDALPHSRWMRSTTTWGSFTLGLAGVYPVLFQSRMLSTVDRLTDPVRHQYSVDLDATVTAGAPE